LSFSDKNQAISLISQLCLPALPVLINADNKLIILSDLCFRHKMCAKPFRRFDVSSTYKNIIGAEKGSWIRLMGEDGI